jgi:glycerol-3-phosphate dehydrogenase
VTAVYDTEIVTTRGPIPYDLAVNCAGLWCDDVAKMTGITDYTIRPCRGDYYAVNKKLFDRPIYHLPLKESHGLGLHVTPTMDGQTLIGPNDFFIEDKWDYKHKSNEKDFADSLNYYLKFVTSPNGGEVDSRRLTGEGGLMVSQSGNRPKLFKNGQPVNDFTFIKNKNWIHCLGIESPGLTAAPAVGRWVLAQI